MILNNLKNQISQWFSPNVQHGKKLKKSYFNSLSRHELHNVLLSVVNKETKCGGPTLEEINYLDLNAQQINRLKKALVDPEYWRYEIVSDILHSLGYYIKLEPVKFDQVNKE